MTESNPPFVIFALPRSRTAWLSRFLMGRDGQYPVGHDILVECKSTSDFFNSFAFGMSGTVETAGVIGWRLIRYRLPNARFVVVRRPLAEVKLSLLQFGIVPLDGELETRDEMLSALAASGEAEVIDYSDLCIPQVCRWLWRYVHQVDWDPSWHRDFAQVNFQVNMAWQLSRLVENESDLRLLRADFVSQLESLPCHLLQ